MKSINSVGIIGFGKFGKLLYELIHEVYPHLDVNVYSRKSNLNGNQFLSLEEVVKSDLIIPAVPASSFKEVISQISPLINPNSIVIDVSSVKMYPVEIMKGLLPKTVTVIASHPLFGPGTLEKVKDNSHLKIVMSFIQGNLEDYNLVKQWISQLQFSIIEMSAEEHDMLMAKSQFISHVIAGILKEYQFAETSIDTNSAELLHEFEKMIQFDNQLLRDMFTYNSYCKKELDQLNQSYKSIMSLFNSQ